MYPRGENCSYRSQGSRRVSFSFFFFFYQVNEISSNIQRYGLFPWLFPLIFFLSDISFCYYNILSSVVMYIYLSYRLYIAIGDTVQREREPLGANGFDLFFYPIIYRMAIKRKQQTRPDPLPLKKKWIKMDDDLITKKFRFDVGNCVPSSVMVKCDGQSDHHQSTTRVKVRSTRTYHISLYGGAL